MPGFFKRLAETFMSCFVMSAPLEFILLYEYVENTEFNTWAIIIASAIAFLAASLFFQITHFVCFRDLKIYFKVNFLVYSIFAVFNLLLWFVLVQVLELTNLYKLLFLPLCVFDVFNIGLLWSAVIFHVLMLIIVYFSPFFTNIDELEELDDIDERNAANNGTLFVEEEF